MDNANVDEVIYCFWTDDNPITPNRLKGLETMRANLGVPICFLDKKGIEERILPEAPLHPAYQYLSAVHKSDYLRCYFMHHFGGGYADIKIYGRNNNWKRCFDFINIRKDLYMIGMHEVPNGSPFQEYNTPEMLEIVLSNGFFIVRQHTEFTKEWLARVEEILDSRYEALVSNPASSPYGGKHYPIGWADILGRVLHRLTVEQYQKENQKFKNCLRPGWLGPEVPYR